MPQKCPKCDRVTLTRNGKTKAGNQKYLCRRDRGGCGYSQVDSLNTHGGVRVQKIYLTNADRQKAHRLRKKQKDAID